MKQERRGPVSPTEPAEEEQPPTGAPWLIKAIKQEQTGPASCPGPAGLEWQQVGGPHWPRPVKTEERSHQLRRHAGPDGSNKRREKPAGPNTKRTSEVGSW